MEMDWWISWRSICRAATRMCWSICIPARGCCSLGSRRSRQVGSRLGMGLAPGDDLYGRAAHRQRHVVVAEALELVVPQDPSGRRVETEEVSVTAGEHAPLVLEHT